MVYEIDAGAPLDRLDLIVGSVRTDVATLVGATIGPDDGLVLATDAAMTAYDGGGALRAKPGCWWVYEGGMWVRYCIA
ncbi:MAG: hypothetical protein ABMB14_01565 [Myxococcota bacterium]